VIRPVLLVDDEAEFTSILSKVLRRRGFTVHVAGTGEAALEALRKSAFGVVVLDVKMPGIDGLHVLAEVTRSLPDTRVILLTGHLAPGDEEQSIAQGAFAYLLKPYPTEQLVGVIEMAQHAAEAAHEPGTGAGTPVEPY
jgi:two-component system response regulator AtoC